MIIHVLELSKSCKSCSFSSFLPLFFFFFLNLTWRDLNRPFVCLAVDQPSAAA